MTLPVTRIDVRLNPDYTKVIPRFFNTGNERSRVLINKVVQMEDAAAEALLNAIFKDFSGRYRNIQSIFLKHFNLIKYLLPEKEQHDLSENKKLLIGSYFTMEYSIEAAALFNPSIVEDPDQDGAGLGQKKVIVSFRATGESHVSSVVFKRGTLELNGMIHFEPSGSFLSQGVVTQRTKNNKVDFENLLRRMALPEHVISNILGELQDQFSYMEIEVVLKSALVIIESPAERQKVRYAILGSVNTSYELHFSADSLLSERLFFRLP